MNYLKVFALLFLSVVCSWRAYAQTASAKNFKLFVSLENAPFDSLYLHDYTEGRHIIIAAKKTKAFNWEITIPDSVVSNSDNMQLLAKRYSAVDNSSTWLRFISNQAGKETVIANVGVDDENTYIYGTYLRKTVLKNEPMYIAGNNKDTVIAIRKSDKDRRTVGTLICEDFSLIVRDANSDIAARSEDPFFSWFMDADGEKQTYDEHLKSYIALAKKYPDSRFYISFLAESLNNYHSKADVKRVYENFLDKRKNTIWAKKIERFLNEEKFPNSTLPTLHKNSSEKIVQDGSKYNLVIFTASWCGPCIAEIPLLKKIHADLGANLILTYVSIDEAKDVASFQKLMKEKRVRWRSLLAYQDVKKIKEKYFVEGIPKNTLIYPDQHSEKVDVRDNSDRAKLYALVKSFNNQKPLKNHKDLPTKIKSNTYKL